MDFEMPDVTKYADKFNESDFWAKVKESVKNISREGLRNVLLLFYALGNPEMPTKTKLFVLGSLAYFASPIDIIPDFIPVVGYADDLAVIAAALVEASNYINYEVEEKADETLDSWFGAPE